MKRNDFFYEDDNNQTSPKRMGDAQSHVVSKLCGRQEDLEQ